jgi:flagellar biosynthesis protein FlhG
MTDQAAALRDARRDPIRFPAPEASGDTPAVVVGSGKGGVGKSVAAISFAAALAETGHRVLLVDGDQNLGNLHVLLGVRPALTPETLLHEALAPADLVIPVAERLFLMPADSGTDAVQRLGPTDRARLQRRVSGIYADYDAVIVDAAAGLDSALRCVALHATRLVVMTMPEATALTDAYALIKVVHGQLPRLPVDVVVNRVHEPTEGDLAFEKLRAAASRFLGRPLEYLGAVPEDREMRALAADPVRLLHPSTGTPAQRAFAALAARMVPRLTTAPR